MDAYRSLPPWLRWARGRLSWVVGKSLSRLCMAVIVLVECRCYCSEMRDVPCRVSCSIPFSAHVTDTPSSRRVCTVKNSLALSPWCSSCMMWRLTSSSLLKRFCNPYPPSEDCLLQSDMLCVLPRQSDTPHPMLTKEVIKRCLGDKCKLMNHSVIEKRPCDFRTVSCEVFFFMSVVLKYSIYPKRSLPVIPQSL